MFAMSYQAHRGKPVSRFTVILKNPNTRTKPVMHCPAGDTCIAERGKIIKTIKDLPHIARRSITFDRGTEFVSWPHLQAQTGTQTWLSNRTAPVKP